MTTLEAARFRRPALPWWLFRWVLVDQVRIIDLKGTNWRLRSGVTALVAALDEDMMAIFQVSFWISFVLYIQVFKCNNQHPASTGQ